MSRQRDYRDYDYEFDEPSYRDRPPSKRQPSRRSDYYEEEYDDRRPYPRQQPMNRGREGDYSRRTAPSSRDSYPPRGRPNRQGYSRPRPDNYNYGYEREQLAPSRPRPQRPRPTQQRVPPIQEAKKSTNRKIFLFAYNLFFYTLTIGILLSSLMFAFSEKSDAAILGHRFYQVLTDSMAPQADSHKGGFYAGDIVIVKLMNGSEVKEGDVVTFRVGEGDRYLTHRMVERLDELNGEKGEYIVTKGDANKTNDPPIAADRVYGKVTFVIPRMGTFLAFIQENVWLCLVCALSTFGFFLVLKAYFLPPEKSSHPSRQPSRI
ncbi:signal peptidase I [Candidatus Enterococcus ferrettii]|uniref:Signal peptidase I n=1 Tax=Candidatus Enterococcus ferrettii TaxID=2815324 RepID=A0ABV0ELW9_9ENTE|nr:signal peptidase I [Enterococcus sp. 665A]MBO1341237.1 signal peptidase I [Enterococcus sp. 665A]